MVALSLVRLAAAIERFPAAQGTSDRCDRSLIGTVRVESTKVTRKGQAQSERSDRY
jgi:hypothetical protein